MKPIHLLSIALVLVSATWMPAGAQGRLVFDPREPVQTAPATRAEIALLDRVVRPAAVRFWRNEHECHGEITVIDAVAGSFTRTGAAQRAILYSWCQPAAAIGFGGIAIVERGRVVAHLSEGGVPWDLARAPDVNGDGRDELLLQDGHMVMGWQEDALTLLSVTPSGVVTRGFNIRQQDCGVEEPKVGQNAWLLYVVPGSRPRFSQRRYHASCANGARYTARGGIVVPDRSSGITFERDW
jgi:hypothetical protein